MTASNKLQTRYLKHHFNHIFLQLSLSWVWSWVSKKILGPRLNFKVGSNNAWLHTLLKETAETTLVFIWKTWFLFSLMKIYGEPHSRLKTKRCNVRFVLIPDTTSDSMCRECDVRMMCMWWQTFCSGFRIFEQKKLHLSSFPTESLIQVWCLDSICCGFQRQIIINMLIFKSGRNICL